MVPNYVSVRDGDVVTVEVGTIYTVCSTSTMNRGQWPTSQLDYLISSSNPFQRDPPRRSHHDHLLTKHIRSPRRARR